MIRSLRSTARAHFSAAPSRRSTHSRPAERSTVPDYLLRTVATSGLRRWHLAVPGDCATAKSKLRRRAGPAQASPAQLPGDAARRPEPGDRPLLCRPSRQAGGYRVGDRGAQMVLGLGQRAPAGPAGTSEPVEQPRNSEAANVRRSLVSMGMPCNVMIWSSRSWALAGIGNTLIPRSLRSVPREPHQGRYPRNWLGPPALSRCPQETPVSHEVLRAVPCRPATGQARTQSSLNGGVMCQIVSRPAGSEARSPGLSMSVGPPTISMVT
jgi:hypothetical protein